MNTIRSITFLLTLTTTTSVFAREWSDKTGQYQVDADLIGYSDTTVVLKRKPDDLVAVPIEQLSDSDRKYLETQSKDTIAGGGSGIQVWELKSGLKLPGRIVGFDKHGVTIQRRLGKVYVNNQRFDKMPGVYRAIIPKLVEQFTSEEIDGEKGLEDILDRMTAVAAGPGLGTGDGADKTITWLLENWKGPLLLDADAINLLAGSPERLAGRDVPAVLTPHPGELARLLGRSTVEILPDRLGAAREAARRSGAIVVAKGYGSIIAEPAGQAWVNPTGDVGLASGGSGDVLTGTIGALLAQGADPLRAALVGCWLHGRAGEIGGEIYPAAVPASELPGLLADAWRELEEPIGE